MCLCGDQFKIYILPEVELRFFSWMCLLVLVISIDEKQDIHTLLIRSLTFFHLVQKGISEQYCRTVEKCFELHDAG